jgi:hypothetical protein
VPPAIEPLSEEKRPDQSAELTLFRNSVFLVCILVQTKDAAPIQALL